MNEPTSQSPHDAASEPVDDQGRLIDDVVCRRCGYNLRSLEADGVCPECGAAVAISIHGFYLRFAPLKWVRRLALGAKLLVASIATMIVGGLAMMGFGLAIAIMMPQNPSAVWPLPTLMMIMTVSMIGVSLITGGLLIAGVVLLTARDPAEIGKPEPLGSRRLARWCLWPLPVAVVGGGGMSALNNTGLAASVNPLVVMLWIVIGIAWVASYLIMPAAMLRRFMGLMKRVPRPGLVTFAKIEFWAFLVVSVLVFGTYAIAIGMMATLPPAAFATATPTTAPSAVLSQLGYVAGPTSAPVATTLPTATTGPTGNTVTYNLPSGQQVTVTGTGITPMPATMPFGPSTRGFVLTIVTGVAGMLSGCGGIAVAIAGLVFLILTWRALAGAAKQAAENSTTPTSPPTVSS